MTDDDHNTWREYQKLVLNELQRLDSSLEKLTDRIDAAIKHERGNRTQVERTFAAELQRLSIEVHGLKVKAGVWGLIGGLLPVITAILMKQL